MATAVSSEVHELALKIWSSAVAISRLLAEILELRTALGKLEGDQRFRLLEQLGEVRPTIYSEMEDIEEILLLCIEARSLVGPAATAAVPTRRGVAWMWAAPEGKDRHYFHQNPRRFWDKRAARISLGYRAAAARAINLEMARVRVQLERFRGSGHVPTAVWWLLDTPLGPEDGHRKRAGRLAVLHWALAYLETGRPPEWQPAIPSRPIPPE